MSNPITLESTRLAPVINDLVAVRCTAGNPSQAASLQTAISALEQLIDIRIRRNHHTHQGYDGCCCVCCKFFTLVSTYGPGYGSCSARTNSEFRTTDLCCKFRHKDQ